jgi:vanadium chloroperoxidase
VPDAILTWNLVGLEANRVSHTEANKAEQPGPTLSARALAMVHLAMYDAYAGVLGNPSGLPPYLPDLPTAPAGSSAQAAVAAAAHTALVALYTKQRDAFDRALAQHGNPQDPGHAFGVRVARALLADRANDPGVDDAGHLPSDKRHRHRPDPDNPGQGYYGPFFGRRSKGFAITARHELDAPPKDDGEYLRALRQVRAKGIRPDLLGTIPRDLADERQSAQERLVGVFWAYDGAINVGTPPRLYNQIIRRVSEKQGTDEAGNARLFALVNVAMADAGILAWDQKFIHDFWRPVVGIREHDMSCGPAPTDANNDLSNDADPDWLPFGAPRSNASNVPLLAKVGPVPLGPPTNLPPSVFLAQASAFPNAETAADDDGRRLDDADVSGHEVREREAQDADAERPRATGLDDVRTEQLRCAMCVNRAKNFTPNFPAYPSGHATFGAAAFHIARLFYGVKVGNRSADDLADGLSFVSDELNADKEQVGTQDVRGTVRPRHHREFPDGLWQMLIENGASRVYLGVHWVFDAFKLKGNGQPNVSKNVGGVPLGLRIAEDIFRSGMRKSTVGPRP